MAESMPPVLPAEARWRVAGVLSISVLFLALLHYLGEAYRLRWLSGPWITSDVVHPYVSGALLAAGTCWIAVLLYAAGRYVLTVVAVALALAGLVIYEVAIRS